MNDNGSSISEISNVIRLKERELHEIHEIRCAQLEQMVKDRDNMLIESSKRFEQLKEDFQYNLTLLEARDQEIIRLENILDNLEKSLQTKEEEVKRLNSSIEKLQAMEQGKRNEMIFEKNASKKILKELTEEIESIRWATTEEMKSKARELEIIREDMRRIIMSREEALESQRQDLTGTFELLIKQREESFVQREREINQQVTQLETKFQYLQTENTRLRSESIDFHRKYESKIEEISMKEEQIRQLQWRLDDERQSRQASEEGLFDQIKQLKATLSKAQSSTLEHIDEYELKLKKSSNEWQREKDHRMTLESNLQELKEALQQEQMKYQQLLTDSTKHEHVLFQDMTSLQSERDSLLLRLSTVRTDFENLNIRYNELKLSSERVQQELGTTQERLKSQELDSLNNKKEVETLSEELLNSKIMMNKNESIIKSLQNEKSTLERLQIEFKLQAESDWRRKELEANERESSLLVNINELEQMIETERSRQSQLKSEVNVVEMQLKDEKAEAAALRLRLQLLENKLVDRDRDVDKLISQLQSGSQLGSGATNLPNFRNNTGIGFQTQPDNLNSPLFSEDLGPVSVSLPPSPMLRYNPDGRSAGTRAATQRFPLNDQRIGGDGMDESRNLWEIEQENEQLKRLIKEMRGDVEMMREQVHQQEGKKLSQAEIEALQEELDEYKNMNKILEGRLEQSLQEVYRIRQERNKLMDTCNELRATLRRIQSADTGELDFSSRPDRWSPESFSSNASYEDQSRGHRHRNMEDVSIMKSEGGVGKRSEYLDRLEDYEPETTPIDTFRSRSAEKSRYDVKAWTDESFRTSPSKKSQPGRSALQITRAPILDDHSSAIRGKTSERATSSQVRSLEKLKKQAKAREQEKLITRTDPSRKIRNYADGE